jgi:O-antigen/teichoic acid export membrane protein
VIVAVGNLSSSVFLLFASVLVARLLGVQAYGLYSLAVSLPLFIQIFCGFGMRTAINRYAAYHLARGEVAIAQRMTKNAILLMALSSLGITALNFVLAGWMSSALLDRPTMTLYLEAASILTFGQAIYNFLTPAFVAWRAPFQDAIWTIVQAVLKLAISVGLILFGFGIFGAIYGYVFASVLAGIFGVLVLYFTKLRGNSGNVESSWSFRGFVDDVNKMIRYGLPAFTGNIILVFSQRALLTIVIAYIASNAIVGYYSAAANIINQSVLVISASLTAAIFAAFASLDGINSETGIAFKYAVKYVSYFLMPFLIFIVATSGPIIEIVYGTKFLGGGRGPYYLDMLSIAYLPYAFGYAVLTCLWTLWKLSRPLFQH